MSTRRYAFVILLAASSCARPDTTWVTQASVAGNWTADGSPYMIQTDLNVPTGQSLSINPGVTVFFSGAYALSVDNFAGFNALGAANDSIRFTTDTLSNPQMWQGIHIGDAEDTCRMFYTIVENVRPGT